MEVPVLRQSNGVDIRWIDRSQDPSEKPSGASVAVLLRVNSFNQAKDHGNELSVTSLVVPEQKNQ